MATAATIKKNIAKLEAALKSKATPKSLKPKLETQLVKSKAELSGMNKGTKPKTSSTKSTQTALQKLKAMVNKNKKYKTYKGAGVDLEKDADRPALRTGKRVTDGTHYPYKKGNVYYEYRANRIDVKQPPKKYPKLEKGGYMARGGNVEGKSGSTYKIEMWKSFDDMMSKQKPFKIVYSEREDDLRELGEDNRSSKLYMKRKGKYMNITTFLEKGGYMAKGGEMAQVNKMSKDELKNWLSENYGYRGVDGKGITKELKDRTIENMRKEVLSQMKYNEKNNIKYAKGGYMADGGSMDLVNAEIYTIRRNIMGTTSFMMKIKGMRNPQDFSVYPISADQAGQPITIQSDTRFGFLDLSSGRGLMSQSHANGAYSYHFTMDKKVPFKISETDLQRLKDHISGTAGSSVGNMGISSDNSGASMMAYGGYMAKGGEIDYSKQTSDDFKLGEIVWDTDNKRYGTIIGIYDEYASDKYEVRLDSDGMQPTENLRKVGSKGDKGTKEQLKEAIEDYARLVKSYPKNNYPQQRKEFVGQYAEGGISDKEVAESNAEMVLSQIKAVKHHAQELSNVVSKNSDIEAWVVAKIERASTDLSDITHYLEFQTNKMAMGGEIHRTQD